MIVCGFIKKTPKGREATPLGVEHALRAAKTFGGLNINEVVDNNETYQLQFWSFCTLFCSVGAVTLAAAPTGTASVCNPQLARVRYMPEEPAIKVLLTQVRKGYGGGERLS